MSSEIAAGQGPNTPPLLPEGYPRPGRMGNYTLWSAALNRKIPRSTMAGWIRDGVIPPADTRVGRSPYWFETTVHQTLTSREKKVAA